MTTLKHLLFFNKQSIFYFLGQKKCFCALCLKGKSRSAFHSVFDMHITSIFTFQSVQHHNTWSSWHSFAFITCVNYCSHINDVAEM